MALTDSLKSVYLTAEESTGEPYYIFRKYYAAKKQ